MEEITSTSKESNQIVLSGAPRIQNVNRLIGTVEHNLVGLARRIGHHSRIKGQKAEDMQHGSFQANGRVETLLCVPHTQELAIISPILKVHYLVMNQHRWWPTQMSSLPQQQLTIDSNNK